MTFFHENTQHEVQPTEKKQSKARSMDLTLGSSLSQCLLALLSIFKKHFLPMLCSMAKRGKQRFVGVHTGDYIYKRKCHHACTHLQNNIGNYILFTKSRWIWKKMKMKWRKITFFFFKAAGAAVISCPALQKI